MTALPNRLSRIHRTTIVTMALVLFGLITSAHAQNVLEDAEDGLTTGWRIYDSTPAGASISNIADGESRAISFTTDGTANGFRFGGTSSSNGGLDIRDSTRISWRMRSAEDYVVYIALETDLGLRYLTYTNSDKLSPAGSSTYINIGLGCLLYTSPSPRDGLLSRMPSSA